MSETEPDARQIERQVGELAEAMTRIRDDQASRDDVVVEMKQASRARLELLAEALQPVFADVPADNEQFEFALTNGEPPRLWIDMTAFVRMGRDRRVYEFVKDTRLGRTILARSDDREKMARLVTNYIAERILERERMIEGEWMAVKDYDLEDNASSAPEETETAEPINLKYIFQLIGWFLIGVVGGALAMVLWAWFGDIPAFLR